AFYVERPTLLAPSVQVERAAIAMIPALLDSIRAMRPIAAPTATVVSARENDATAMLLAPRLYAAGARVVPAAALAVTVQRYLPTGWRPYYLRSLANGVRDLRRVFPSLRLDELHVRFRTAAPSDSALAMHDPRTRTLHLPVVTAGGTLTHEIAHDLDRRSAQQQ